jgi:hypothetical protein
VCRPWLPGETGKSKKHGEPASGPTTGDYQMQIENMVNRQDLRFKDRRDFPFGELEAALWTEGYPYR